MKYTMQISFDIRFLPEFQKHIEDFPSDKSIEIDLASVESMDTAAAQFLLSLKKTKLNQEDRFVLKGLNNPVVKNLLDQIGTQL